MPPAQFEWTVLRPAAPRYAFFISHVGEDSRDVIRLKSEIIAQSGQGGQTPIDCFLDLQNWQIGNENSTVIRASILQSAHMVIWVTPAYLKNPRGWVCMELAYAELL